jgi:hypothetical protein
VKELGSGVPDLVVAAYDAERELRDPSVAPLAPATAAVGGTLARLGKRIGSVITGNTGDFEFSAEDLGYAGTDARPDLLIAVFAPEDVQGVEQPFPLPPEQRLLYVSRVPRTDAGAEEAYLIRVLQAQLDKFQISAGRPAKVDADTRGYLGAIEAKGAFRQKVVQGLAPQLNHQVTRAIATKSMAKDKVKGLNALPPSRASSPFILRDPKKLDEVQQAAVQAGLQGALGSYKGKLHVTFSSQELAALDLRPDPTTGMPQGSAKQVDLLATIFAKVGGVDLVRTHEFVDSPSTAAALLRKYRP